MNPRRIARKIKHYILVDNDICLLELSADASALNEAIQTTKRPYIGFTDVKNSDKDRYFNSLLAELKRHPDVDMAGGFLKPKKKKLSFQEGLPEDTAVLDANADFSLGIMYPEGILCKTEVIRDAGVRFDDSLEYYRDEVFALQLSNAMQKRVYVPSLIYSPKREFDELKLNGPRTHQPGWYWELVQAVPDKLHNENGKVLKRSVQHGLLYHVLLCFVSNENANVKMVFEDVPETLRYLEVAGKALRSIGLAVMFGRRRGTKWTNPKLLYLVRLRNNMKQPELEAKLNAVGNDGELHCKYYDQHALVQRFSPTFMYVQNLNLESPAEGADVFKMHVRFPTCFPTDTFELYMTNTYAGTEHSYQLTETEVLSSCRTYFDQKAYDTVLWDVDIPLSHEVEDQVISAYAIFKGVRIPLKIGMLNKSTNRLRDDCPEAFWSIPSYMVHMADNRILITPASEEDKRLAEERYCQVLEQGNEHEVECARLRRMYYQTKGQFEGKRIWVYFDKAFKGGDNAEFLIRYASQQDDGIDHIFYIDPGAADYERIKNDGLHVLNPKSDEGLMHLLNAEIVFATHVPAYRIPGIKDRDMPCFKDLLKSKNIRLYHGFTLTHDCSYAQAFMDSSGVAVSSRYEHELYADPVHGFKEEQIIDSGMPRHDGVLPNNQRWILFAPTWRPALRGGVGFGGRTLYNEHFRESRYYQHYHAIFTDERLLECARRNGYKIKLYLHPRMAPMTVDFEPDQNDVFEAIDCTQGTEYADIMSKSDLMITDYSSVMIDFAYSRKPVIYYQDPALPYWRYFDFDYKNIGFGEVVASTDAVVDLVCEYMENNCTLKDFYRKRIDDFFFYDDRNGSKRLYEAVREMVG